MKKFLTTKKFDFQSPIFLNQNINLYNEVQGFQKVINIYFNYVIYYIYIIIYQLQNYVRNVPSD